jgi:RHS repeat-associated protein
MPWLHGHQVKAIALMVEAVLEHQTGIQAELVRSMGNQEASQKQLSRLIHNERLDPRKLADSMLDQTLAHLPKTGRVRVALDWTIEDDQHLLVVSLLIKGRAIPMFWRAYRASVLKGRMKRYEAAIIKRCLDRIRRVIGKRRVILTADRGFADVDLCDVLQTGYNKASEPVTTSIQGQSVINYTFDTIGRLQSQTQGAGTVSYTFDGVNRPTIVNLPNNASMVYTYDAGGQVKTITYKSGATTIGSLTYEYDNLGRQIKQGGPYARVTIPNAVASAIYDNANKLINWGGLALTYDANGSLSSDNTYSYTWNARNQLVDVKLKTTAVTQGAFGYDGAGRRQDRNVGGTPTGYLHNGINPVQEQQGATTNNVLAGGTDTFFSRSDANGNRTYLRDRLGSTVGLVDSAGTVQTSYTYEPFGKTSSAGQTSTNPYQYTGRENDGLGLMYYRARYYSPILHRFISEDPIGCGDGPNRYIYVRNDPISYRDASGKDRTDPWVTPQLPGPGPIFPPNSGPVPTLPRITWPSPIQPPKAGPVFPTPRPVVPDQSDDEEEKRRQRIAIEICIATICEPEKDMRDRLCRVIPGRKARERCWAKSNDEYGDCIAACSAPAPEDNY